MTHRYKVSETIRNLTSISVSLRLNAIIEGGKYRGQIIEVFVFCCPP